MRVKKHKNKTKDEVPTHLIPEVKDKRGVIVKVGYWMINADRLLARIMRFNYAGTSMAIQLEPEYKVGARIDIAIEHVGLPECEWRMHYRPSLGYRKPVWVQGQ